MSEKEFERTVSKTKKPEFKHLILISHQTLKYIPMESCQRLNDFFVI